MAALRWVLLLAGLLFLAGLAWWELRRPRQASRDAHLRTETREAVHNGPVIDLPPLGDEELGLPAAEPPFTAPQAAMTQPEPTAPEPTAPETTAEQPTLTVSAAVSGLVVAEQIIVEWPPEDERQILNLRIVPTGADRFSGRTLRQALGACGFVHGRFGIYHQPDERGRALLSAASLSRPGILDPANMDFQRFSGLSLFAVLPGAMPAPTTLEHLLEVARDLSQRLGGGLRDEQGAPLDAERLEAWRQALGSRDGGTSHGRAGGGHDGVPAEPAA
ncbi:MAG: cell division protein ZipA C-terminal FtsZ-binding domain-containing protein [Steroidobacterales bacterium]